MQHVLIYSPQDSPRLRHVLDWIFNDQLKTDYRLTHDPAERHEGMILSYGNTSANISIPTTDLLWETSISVKDPNWSVWQGLPVLFHSAAKGYSLPFDLFSAIFFLLSRYEEYYTYTPDKHNRYPATESVLYKSGHLRRPLIDEWLAVFRELLSKHGANIACPSFTWQPSYDIDIAWSYLHKGLTRNLAGLTRDVLSAKFSTATERLAVLSMSQKDPFDSFAFLQQLHNDANVRPLFFILAALKSSPFDKNISLANPAMKSLIRQLAAFSDIGMHPSYYTDRDKNSWQNEKDILERITGRKVTSSRQHYIRMVLPGTYRHLLQNGITDDYSLGYGSHLGFRAGTGRSFKWYDLEREQTEGLTIHPFCFMDSTAHYEEQLDAEEAFGILGEMAAALRKTGSILTTVFHNFSLGTDNEWKGWSENYKHFVDGMTGK
ncbi:MAG: polysaccharide deacetylase family protein [Bacteroidetes bacterium]|nr:polysaccharide deacetylase family protein [Bacteroidota bacterium]